MPEFYQKTVEVLALLGTFDATQEACAREAGRLSRYLGKALDHVSAEA
jgi:hypothetical protein